VFRERLSEDPADDSVGSVRVRKRAQKRKCHKQARNELKRSVKNCIVVKDMSNVKPVRCQKCGKPLGYITVVAKGLTSLSQLVQNAKIIAICMEWAHG
jgi:hypothetical protein